MDKKPSTGANKKFFLIFLFRSLKVCYRVGKGVGIFKKTDLVKVALKSSKKCLKSTCDVSELIL